MAAATPGDIWEFHQKVVKDRTVTIDFCLGLERKDGKYAAALIKDIKRLLDHWQDLALEALQGRRSDGWPPNLDRGDDRERFVEDHLPDPGDADIRYWLGKAAGEVDKPLGKSLHDQVIKQFRSLYAETHDPELASLWDQSDLPEYGQLIDLAIRRKLAEIAHKHREELEKITPDMLEAEVVAACRLLEEKQHFSDNLDEGVAVYRGKGLYQVGNEWIRLDGYKADVLETLVELRAATFEQLQKSGCDNPSAVLKAIRDGKPLLAPFIKMAGSRGSGGYSTTIRNAIGK